MSKSIARSIRYRERKLAAIRERQQALYDEQQSLEDRAYKLELWLAANRPYVPLEDPVAEANRKEWKKMVEKWNETPWYVLRHTNPDFAKHYTGTFVNP